MLIFTISNALAQQNIQQLFDKYVKAYPYYQPAMFFTDQKFHSAQHLPDTLDVLISTPQDVQKIIDAHLQNYTYGICITKSDTTDLDKIIKLLVTFPNLNFLRINELGVFPRTIGKTYQLPPAIKQLQQLKGIEFFYTQNLDISDALKKIAGLKNLYAIAFGIQNTPLPRILSTLKNIKAISISPDNLDSIDLTKVNWQLVSLKGVNPNIGPDQAALKKLTRALSIKSLYLDYCNLGNCDELSAFNQLKSLSIKTCTIDKTAQLFQKISPLKDLLNLDISLYLDSTQKINGFEKLTKLQSLKLTNVATLGADPTPLKELSNLKDLQTLSLNSIAINSMPDVFGNLKELRSLTIYGTQLLCEVPASMFRLPKLQALNLAWNKLSALPDIPVYECRSLKSLNLNSNGFVSLPKALTSLTKLQYFDASYNKISSIPVDGWQNLTQLKYINLSFNNINIFPGGLQQISGLETIEFTDNNLTEMPDLNGDNYKLKKLNLQSNEIRFLPEHIGLYTKLEDLNVAGNSLTTLPTSLGDCKNLKDIDLRALSYKTLFDVDRLTMDRVRTSEKDTTKLNNINALPEGLKDAANIYQLNLSGNRAINNASVFKVLLGTSRPYSFINISDTGIDTIPPSVEWANAAFYDLDLSRNKIKYFPAEFANIKSFHNINLYKNPIRTKSGVGIDALETREDMKLLFDETGVDLPDFKFSAIGYAQALAKRVTTAYNKEKWAAGVAYANRALTIDAVSYGQKVKWDEIGTCRYKTGDYKGAIKDFEAFIAKDDTSHMHLGWALDEVEENKANAHIALGQPEKAAETHLHFARKNVNNLSGYQKAADVYRSLGREDLYRQYIDTAIFAYQKKAESYKKYNENRIDPAFILDYAEMLIIANKATDALKLINEKDAKIFAQNLKPIRSYLLATATLLSKTADFESVKQTLVEEIKINGKITGWDFGLFNNWLSSANITAIKKKQLTALQELAK